MTGSGTLLDPYVIWDVNDLQNMSLDLAAYYELGQDIDASATTAWNGGEGFIPVGSWPAPVVAFSGSLDGKDHVITELTINRLPPASWDNFQALFGYTDGSGEIKNIGLVDCSISAYRWVGALVGFHEFLSGKTKNCYSTGLIRGWSGAGGLFGYNGAESEDCHSDCQIVAEAGALALVEEVGGLIGENDGKTSRCYATGNMLCTSDWDVWGIGGCIGIQSFSETERCLATGNVSVNSGDKAYDIGGFIGDNWSNGMFNCYARGDVTVVCVDPSWGNVGGFSGYNRILTENCYSTGLITVPGAMVLAGGFCGDTDGSPINDCFWDTETSGILVSAGGTGKTTAEMKTESTFTDTGWDFVTIWDITPGCNNDYPCLLNVTPSCGVPVVPFVINKSYALAREEL